MLGRRRETRAARVRRRMRTYSDPLQHACIAGKTEITEGVLRDQAVAVIPIEILCL